MKDKELVSKSNVLIEASYTLNLVAQRLIVLAIIKARNQGELSKVGSLHRITAIEYQAHFGCALPMAYESLKSACKSLYESDFVWIGEDEDGDPQEISSRFVQRAAYNEGKGYVEVMFGNDIIPLITRLSREYTEYELIQIRNLNSVYALRVFEALMQWRMVGKTPLITIGNLRKRLGVEDHQYKTMSNFKTRVLDLAVSQINDHTDITAAYEQHKTGRKVTGFTFSFKQKPSTKPAAKEAKPARDTDTPDMFNDMTDSQIATFSSKLARLPELGNDAPIGGSTDDYATLIATHLADPVKQKKYHQHLNKLGYKPTKSKA
ncbi:replication initiation protein RepM [Psychrobacter sp. 16-MNA-CIBAN-0192]|uniref:replication initiation protein RepM n=1 Tax=Psychrobacter sp. 16-MNA-CIBAN-0192 TaxID=3140448 RepID=UPI00331941A9